MPCFLTGADRHAMPNALCQRSCLFAGFQIQFGAENAPAAFKILERVAAPAALRQDTHDKLVRLLLPGFQRGPAFRMHQRLVQGTLREPVAGQLLAGGGHLPAQVLALEQHPFLKWRAVWQGESRKEWGTGLADGRL